MNESISNLHVRVHKLDRSISTFVQEDFGKSKQILEDFRPMDLFNEQKIVLADRNSHTTIPVCQITRVDLDSGQHSHLLFPTGLVEAVELSKIEFETLIQNVTIRDQWKHLGEQDAFVVTFLNIEMADGQSVLLTMEVDAKSPQGLSELRDYLLSRSGLCFRMRSGGVAVLNLANLARLTFFPGTLQPPAEAWNVRLLETEQSTKPADSPSPDPVPMSRKKLTIQQRV